jgi:hypothetical protein
MLIKYWGVALGFGDTQKMGPSCHKRFGTHCFTLPSLEPSPHYCCADMFQFTCFTKYASVVLDKGGFIVAIDILCV